MITPERLSENTRAGKGAVAHLGQRVSLAIKALRIVAVERGFLTNGAEMGIDGDWERGRVWFKRMRTEEPVVTIYRRTNRTSSELVVIGEIVPGWNEDFAALWNEAMDEANLREWERLAAPRFAFFHLLSWNVAQVPAWPPMTRCGAVSKKAKEWELFFRDLGKRSSLVDARHTRIHCNEWGGGH